MNEQPPLTKTKVLLVEGRDEVEFFSEFFKYLSIDDVQIRQVFGKDRFPANLRNFMNERGYDQVTAFGIVRDADTNSASTFQSVAKSLENLDLPFPKRSGEFANKARKKIGVFIMPDGASYGMLEHLCLQTVDSHPVMKHVNIMFSSLGNELSKRHPPDARLENGKYYYPKNEAKAKAQAFLSGMHETVNSVGLGAKFGYWNFDHPVLSNIKAFLENLRVPV